MADRSSAFLDPGVIDVTGVAAPDDEFRVFEGSLEEGRFVGAIRYESIRRLEQQALEHVASDPSPRTGAALAELYGLGLRGLLGWGALAAGDARVGRSSGSEP